MAGKKAESNVSNARDMPEDDAFARALRQQLKAIESEEIPDRLLVLARQLQTILREQAKAGAAPAPDKAKES